MPTPCYVRHQGQCADALTSEALTLTLDVHNVQNYTSAEGIVYAFEEATITDAEGVTRNASDWVKAPTNVHDLAAWLGY